MVFFYMYLALLHLVNIISDLAALAAERTEWLLSQWPRLRGGNTRKS